MNTNEYSVNKILAILAVAILLLVATGCDDHLELDDAARVLAGEGVTQTQFTGYDGGACADSDLHHTGFTGMRNGVSVRGTVCGGRLKGYTVRYH